MAWVTLNDCLSTVSIAKGGTGLTSAPMLATNLASTSAASIFQSDPRPGVVGILPIANGGTNATDKVTALNNLGIFIGTKVITATNANPLLLSYDELVSIIGRGFDSRYDTVVVMNGDYNAIRVSCYGAYYNPSSKIIGVNLSSSPNGQCRINYAIILGRQ